MESKVLDFNNPNRDILVVDTEEGGSEGDNMSSMIGDAVAKHVESLTIFERQVWEHFIVMGGQNIFDLEPNLGYIDSDPFGLQVEDLDNFKENFQEKCREASKNPKYRLSDKLSTALDEAIENERERRSKAELEDAYDNPDAVLIPYEDWEENPQLSKHFQIPTTPPNKTRYAGNVTQQFYDNFAWYERVQNPGHPDARVINQFLTMINRDADELTDRYGDYLANWLSKQPIREKETLPTLYRMIDVFVEGKKNADDIALLALEYMDEGWGKRWRQSVLTSLAKEPMRALLAQKDKEWTALQDSGASPYSSVKNFGALLFKKYRKLMKGSDWSLYHQIKTKYAPKLVIPVILNGKRENLDLNRCRMSYLERGLSISHAKAAKLWDARPFESLDQLQNQGYLSKDALAVDEKAESVVQLVRERFEAAKAQKNARMLTSMAQQLMDSHRKNAEGLSPSDWSAIWQYYRFSKAELTALLPKETTNDARQEG